jgi:hypothetical protein
MGLVNYIVSEDFNTKGILAGTTLYIGLTKTHLYVIFDHNIKFCFFLESVIKILSNLLTIGFL